MAELRLVGFEYSVYTRIVRIALIELGLRADYVEVDPFAGDPALDLYTPLGRVPVLCDGDFILTETGAILRYLARRSGAGLMPRDPLSVARMDQVIGIADGYVYGALVRRVFSNGFYGPRMAEPFDPAEVAAGLRAGAPALTRLNDIAKEGLVLDRQTLTLADLHLAPMIDYLTRVPEGVAALAAHPALAAWWQVLSQRASLRVTDPFGDVPRPQ